MPFPAFLKSKFLWQENTYDNTIPRGERRKARVTPCCLPAACLSFPAVHWVWVGNAQQKAGPGGAPTEHTSLGLHNPNWEKESSLLLLLLLLVGEGD